MIVYGIFWKKKVAGYEVYGEKKKMDKKEYLKKILKAIGKGTVKAVNFIVPPKTAEQVAFEKELAAKTQKSQRDAYLKESLKQAKKKGEALAKQKYGHKNNVLGTQSSEAKKKNDDIMDTLMRL